MLRRRLPGHRLPRAELAERLPIALVQQVENLPAGRIRQRPEHLVQRIPSRSHSSIMQVFACLSNPPLINAAVIMV
jgi:hypothetical protein